MDVPRPAGLDPRSLGFTRQRPVAWLAPGILARTGLRTLLTLTFGAYLDKRELQGALPARWHRQDGENGELWIDYVADLGDGFDATYTIAWLLAQPTLNVDGHELRRGHVLVMGGDLVYPLASMQAYEDRTKGPYTAALPQAPTDGPAPTLYALPANHDWYDGLTSFLRLFAGERADNLGGWRLEQTRSYFAVQLPHRWWLFAVDEAVDSYFDDPQLVYFSQAARHLRPGDQVIIAAPAPTWAKPDPTAYRSLDFFIRRIIAPTGAEVRLMLSGDAHHYARYEHPERQLVTCGGGGAYLTATHTIPEQITVPPRESIDRKCSPRRDYRLAARYPDARTSRRMARGVFARLPLRNRGFVALVGVLHTLLMLAVAGAAIRLTEVEARLVTIPLAVTVLAVLGAAVGLAYTPTGGPKRGPRYLVAGMLHGAAHIGLGIAGGLAWLRLPFHDLPWPLPLLAAGLVYLPVAGLVGSELIALYLLVASRFGVNVNELFASQGIEDAKCFLRMHIARDGTLTIYPVAVPKVCHSWRADPDAPRPDASWIVPDGEPPRPCLAEEPVTVGRPSPVRVNGGSG
ncbi:MAG: metallophosphoesterase [Micromonosporaceae bacterium]